MIKHLNFKKNLLAQPDKTSDWRETEPGILHSTASAQLQGAAKGDVDEHHYLVREAQHGNLEAFNSLVSIYQQRVYNLAYRMLGEAEGAADATQDTFFQAYRALYQFRGGSFKSWLLRIASNLCYDQMRLQVRRPSTSLDALLDEGEEFNRNNLNLIQAENWGSDPQGLALQQELAGEIGNALQRLSYDQRLVVVLSDVQGLSYEEIVEITGCSLGTVKSRLNRARLKLREILQKTRELIPGDLRYY